MTPCMFKDQVGSTAGLCIGGGREFSQHCGHLSSAVAPRKMQEEILALPLGRALQQMPRAAPLSTTV